MPILTLGLPISAVRLPISAKSAMKTAEYCRFCVLGARKLPKVMPIMLIYIYTMCQYTSSEPASVQTQIFTHRYGVKIFQVCFNTTVHCVFTGVARRFWRCARRHLLMFAMTLVWSKTV
jgi:hypothetical protein